MDIVLAQFANVKKSRRTSNNITDATLHYSGEVLLPRDIRDIPVIPQQQSLLPFSFKFFRGLMIKEGGNSLYGFLYTKFHKTKL